MYGPFASYVKFRVAHAPGMPGTFSPPPPVSDPDMHHGTCVTHVPWCMPGSLNSGFPLKSVAGKTFPAFQAHAQPSHWNEGIQTDTRCSTNEGWIENNVWTTVVNFNVATRVLFWCIFRESRNNYYVPIPDDKNTILTLQFCVSLFAFC